ncbi:hypothetical protein GNP81_07905 [Aliivibrio fischeri]|uniref:hypothetical protein n=1 Tax=Aliivibrio fischeri TaxID=668 RepID=UPI0012D869FC|nr:hypothetical protein [Aliivibrio fischeri]MUK60737.1 hypothetical protein [Aliivibrio fischeri]MUL20757.1 hypothetical protein [Aliivibrio fischeri]MUL24532.1 hypothetical protein [Aliivibrio fischeri]
MVYKTLQTQPDRFRFFDGYHHIRNESDQDDLVFTYRDEKITVQIKSLDSLRADKSFSCGSSEGFDAKNNCNNGTKAYNSDLYIFAYVNLNEDDGKIIREIHETWNSCEDEGFYKTDVEQANYQRIQESVRKDTMVLDNWTFYVTTPETVSTMIANNKIAISKLDISIESKLTYKTDAEGLCLVVARACVRIVQGKKNEIDQ